MLPVTGSGIAVSPRTALAIADAYACVRCLADAASSLPLHVYRRTDEDGRARVHGGVADLLRYPAPAVTQSAFLAQLVAHLQLHGEAFVGKYRNAEQAVQQLGLISPDRVNVEVKGGMPIYGLATEDGRFDYFSTADIIHIKGLSLDGVRGLSPIRQAREALGYAAALAQHGSDFISQGARPSGVLYVQPGAHADEQIENLKAAWEDRHAVAGRVGLLTGEVKFEAVSMPLADAQFLEQREFSTSEVARIFRVPPWMIGAKTGDSLTYSTVAEQARAFVTFSLRPWLIAIEQAISADVDLFPPEQRTYAAFELDALLRADPKTRAEIWTAALDETTGWMRREEVRRLEDLPAEQEEPAHA